MKIFEREQMLVKQGIEQGIKQGRNEEQANTERERSYGLYRGRVPGQTFEGIRAAAPGAGA